MFRYPSYIRTYPGLSSVETTSKESHGFIVVPLVMLPPLLSQAIQDLLESKPLAVDSELVPERLVGTKSLSFLGYELCGIW